MKTWLVLAVALAAPSAQSFVQPHRFLDWINLALFLGLAATLTLDVISSRRALKIQGTVEANAVARVFGLIPVKIGGFVAALVISYLLHRAGHHSAARVIPVIVAVPSAIAAIHNFSI